MHNKNQYIVGGMETFPKESQKILCMSDGLQDLLTKAGCWIAGGAVSSVFTGKPINDLDIYFPSKQALYDVAEELYKKSNICWTDAHICHVTNKSILLQSEKQQVQLIVFKFFDSVEDIFNSFDFTACMGAYSLASNEFILHPDFLKHNSQRFLSFNPKTAYPLISMLRVEKYVSRGYTTSKQEMLKIGFAIANKDFSSWEQVIDEVGSMYGIDESKIFDTKKEFSIDEVILQLGNLLIPEHYISDVPGSLRSLIAKMPDKFPEIPLKEQDTGRSRYDSDGLDIFD